MKRLIPFIAITAFLSILLIACKNNPQVQSLSQTDTTGFAEFQAFKAMEKQVAVTAPQKIVYRQAPAKKVVMTSETTNEAKVAKKKGWSKAAKYSVIGGAGGAVLGAVIHKKNPVLGGVVGAVILGGGGYVLGRSKDKKEGRY